MAFPVPCRLVTGVVSSFPNRVPTFDVVDGSMTARDPPVAITRDDSLMRVRLAIGDAAECYARSARLRRAVTYAGDELVKCKPSAGRGGQRGGTEQGRARLEGVETKLGGRDQRWEDTGDEVVESRGCKPTADVGDGPFYTSAGRRSTTRLAGLRRRGRVARSGVNTN